MTEEEKNEKLIELYLLANSACEAPNETYTVTCPICGGAAHATARRNGFVNVKCDSCDAAICG